MDKQSDAAAKLTKPIRLCIRSRKATGGNSETIIVVICPIVLLRSGYSGDNGACGRDGEDRGLDAAHRQCSRCRSGLQDGNRGRNGYHQQCPSRTRQSAARPDCGAAQSGRRQARRGLCRSPGQSFDGATAGDAAHHARQGQRADGRLSIVVHLHGDARGRTLRHSVHGWRLGRAQHHYPRLQIRLPRHADRYRLRPHLYAFLRRHEEAGQKDRLNCHRQ